MDFSMGIVLLNASDGHGQAHQIRNKWNLWIEKKVPQRKSHNDYGKEQEQPSSDGDGYGGG